MSELYGGVETGGSWCVCALGSGPEGVEAMVKFPTSSPSETLERITDFFAAHPRPRALGVASFGPVDLHRSSPTWGYVTTTPKPGWQQTPLGPQLSERLRLPVVFDTDVGAAALAECLWGAGRGAQSLCYLTVGTGIGGGLVIDGRPWHGLMHPEVGHIRINHDRLLDPFPGSCPWHGDCWEGLASGAAIAARHGCAPEQLENPHPAWELEAGYLAQGLLNIICVASPQRVVIGGGVMQHQGLLELVRARLVRLLGGYLQTPLLAGDLTGFLLASELGDEAGVFGALALAQLAERRVRR